MKIKNSTNFFRVLMCVGIVVCLLCNGCTEKKKEPIKLGIVLPFSGGFEIYGNMGLNGIKMAVAEINAAGGVLGGHPLELVIEDEKTNPAVGVAKTEKVITEDKVIAVFGPVSSASRDAMAPIAAKYKVPLLYGIDYEGGAKNPFLFCYSPIPDHYIKPLIPYLSSNYGNSFYIFGYDYVWPHKMTEAIKKEVAKINGTIAGIEYTPFAVKDYSASLQKIDQSGAKVLMLILPGNDGFNFIRQFKKAGLDKKIKLAAMASEESYLDALTKEESEGVISCVHFLASLDKQETKDFVARQQKMFGPKTVVTYSTESHYGLVMFLRQAIEKAGSTEGEKIVKAMGDLTLTIGNGPVTMRAADHHMILNMIIAEFTNGKLVAKKYIGPIAPDNQWTK